MTDRPNSDLPRPILYILMRDDLDSLNPGKAVAQGAHAANACVAAISRREAAGDAAASRQRQLLEVWQNEVPEQQFGTTVCLAVPDEDTLVGVVALAAQAGLAADTVRDPSYPLQDGRATHLLSLVTCGYLFAEQAAAAALLRQFDLFP